MTTYPVRGRFAPSPTGELHLGNAWAALLAWLQIRHLDGTFVLRIEDLDPDRSRQEYTSALMEDLRWLGLDWDEGPDSGGKFTPYKQSSRQAYYESSLEKLRSLDLVYPCFCTRADIRAAASAPHENKKFLEHPNICRSLSLGQVNALTENRKPYSLRFKTPDRMVSFTDLIFGLQVYNPYRELGDFVVRRSDGVFAYQLAVVVDDAEMHISHVLRGADLLPSTGRQILLYETLGYPIPHFAHIPLLYGPDGTRLSKRHGATSLRHFRKQGIKPEEIVGQLGYWAGFMDKLTPVHPRELISSFDLRKIPQQGIMVNPHLLFKRD